MTASPFVLLVPVKEGARTKSRLAVGDLATRRMLMRAFTRDALAAALRSSLADPVVVGDPDAAPPGVVALPDEGRGDLNAAIRRAERRITPGRPVAVLLGDLPCLTTAELDAALRVAMVQGRRCYVADADGTGTTLLIAPAGRLDPHFGAGSAHRHERSGAYPIPDALPTVRTDVDVTDDLRRAVRLGVGAATTATLRRSPGLAAQLGVETTSAASPPGDAAEAWSVTD